MWVKITHICKNKHSQIWMFKHTFRSQYLRFRKVQLYLANMVVVAMSGGHGHGWWSWSMYKRQSWPRLMVITHDHGWWSWPCLVVVAMAGGCGHGWRSLSWLVVMAIPMAWSCGRGCRGHVSSSWSICTVPLLHTDPMLAECRTGLSTAGPILSQSSCDILYWLAGWLAGVTGCVYYSLRVTSVSLGRWRRLEQLWSAKPKGSICPLVK